MLLPRHFPLELQQVSPFLFACHIFLRKAVLADKESTLEPNNLESQVIEQKAPTRWWLLGATVFVLITGLIFLTRPGPQEEIPCPPLFVEQTSLPNPLENVSGQTTSLVFPISGGNIPTGQDFVAYWNIRASGQVDSYIKQSGIQCTANQSENTLTCSELEFFFPEAVDSIIPEYSVISNSEQCGEYLLLGAELQIFQNSGEMKILRTEGEFVPDE